MQLPEQIKRQAMSAVFSRETAALLKSVQQGGVSGLMQKLLTGATKEAGNVAAQTGWLPLAGMAALYAGRTGEHDHHAGKHKHKAQGNDL